MVVCKADQVVSSTLMLTLVDARHFSFLPQLSESSNLNQPLSFPITCTHKKKIKGVGGFSDENPPILKSEYGVSEKTLDFISMQDNDY